MKISRSMRLSIGVWGLLAMLGLMLTSTVSQAQSNRNRRSSDDGRSGISNRTRTRDLFSVAGPQRAPRVVLLLPTQLGENWKADPRLGRAVLPRADQTLRSALQRSGGQTVIVAHRFEPTLMRAVQDRLITQDQLEMLVQQPTLENAQLVLSQMGLTQTPLIAMFSLEEVRAQGGSVEVQASGRVYEMGNDVPLKTAVVTSSQSAGGMVIDNSRMATVDAVGRAAAEVMVLPQDDYGLMGGPMGTGGGVTLPGDVPITGSSTRPPSTPDAMPDANVTLPGDVPITGSSDRPPSTPETPEP